MTNLLVEDIDFVKNLLPDHYFCIGTTGGVHCQSKIGISENGDSEDDEHWHYIVGALANKFGKRFLSIFHQISFCHRRFTVYIQP